MIAVVCTDADDRKTINSGRDEHQNKRATQNLYELDILDLGSALQRSGLYIRNRKTSLDTSITAKRGARV